MLAVRSKAGKYPPNPQFVRFSDAGPAPAEYKRLQDRQVNGVLEKMQERKKGSLEILKQRAAPYQTAEIPQATVPRPASLPPQEFNIHSDTFHDPDEGNPSSTEATHTESDLPKPASRVRKLASAAVRGGLSAASSVGTGLASAASSASQGLVAATPAIVGAAASANQAATTVGLSAINGAVDTAVAISKRARPVVRKIASSTGQAALSAGQAMASASAPVVQAALDAGGQAALGAGHLALGVGQSALDAGQALAVGAGQALVDYGPSVASAVGHGALAVGQTLGSGFANAAMQAPSFASAAARTAHYMAIHTKMTFDDLMNLIEHAPKAPILDKPKRRRSQSPAMPMLGDQAAPAAATPIRTHQHGLQPLHLASEEEWVKLGKGGLVNQLQLRPGFNEAMGIRHSKENLRKIFKNKTTQQLAQLIMKLDAKAG
jgi:hypothetical protein